MPDLTILTTADGKKLAKTFTRLEDGTWSKEDYDLAFLFDAIYHEATSIDDLSAVLTILENMPQSCIVRGRLKDGFSAENMVRRMHDDPLTPAPLEEQPVHWILVDIDDFPVAPSLTMAQRLATILAALPPCFRDVDFHYQWSSSAGVKGWEMLRCHLWFWLDKPIRCSDLRAQAQGLRWTKKEGGIMDPGLFNPAQVHYTAKPRFTNAPDPLEGQRSGLIRRAHRAVTLPEWSPPPPPVYKKYVPAPATIADEPYQALCRRYAQGALAHAAETIRNQSTGCRTHTTLVQAARMQTHINAGSIGEDEVQEALYDAARSVGLDDRKVRETIKAGRKIGDKWEPSFPEAKQ